MGRKTIKKRNIVALQMQHRHKNGGSAGYHSKKGYSRKEKHKKTNAGVDYGKNEMGLPTSIEDVDDGTSRQAITERENEK